MKLLPGMSEGVRRAYESRGEGPSAGSDGASDGDIKLFSYKNNNFPPQKY